ncbi:MAG: glycerol-3-phosphate dehydrogenase subunit GlpB [Desulfovibrio sp.]
MIKLDKTYDVMVVGAGFAGMAAALFAANRGLSVAQAGSTGGIDFSTGFIDLMGVHPVGEGKRWVNPWDAISALKKDIPKHPYGLLTDNEIADSLDEFTSFLRANGLPYTGLDKRNINSLTSAGTVKQTYLVPEAVWTGSRALETKAPTLIVDFHSLKGFSGRQLVETQKTNWPNLRCVRVDFPSSRGELYPEHMAWSLSDPSHVEQLVAVIVPHLDNAEYIGFPAVLGLNNSQEVLAKLEAMTGRKVFEIPTMPPAIAGSRLRAAFDRGFPALGVRTLSQKMVTKAEVLHSGEMKLQVGTGVTETNVTAKSVVLATGRFFGKGLRAERLGVHESIFDLPVVQPSSREEWHEKSFFDAKGHPLNMSGVEVDGRLRPVDSAGKVVYENLYATGAMLAHHDWMRMKCGAGLAIATAYKAIKGLEK